MIQPGKETNLPNNSGTVGLQGAFGGANGFLGTSVASLDGFTVTMGIVVLIVAAFLAYQVLMPKKRR